MHRTFTLLLISLVAAFGVLIHLPPAQAGIGLLVQLRGLGAVRAPQDNPILAPPGATCFDVEMYLPGSNQVIGTGTDCLSLDTAVIPNAGVPGCAPISGVVDACSVVLTDTTFFNFSFGGTSLGTLVSQEQVTIQPALDTNTLAAGISHITGSFPNPNNSRGNILGGTGIFATVTGSVRTSGGINMLQLLTTSALTFDCLFIIDINIADL